MIERTYKILIAVTEDECRYIIYNAEDLMEKVQEDPQFVTNFLNDLSKCTWCEAYDSAGRPVWIRTSTIMRIEYKEAKIRKG